MRKFISILCLVAIMLNLCSFTKAPTSFEVVDEDEYICCESEPFSENDILAYFEYEKEGYSPKEIINSTLIIQNGNDIEITVDSNGFNVIDQLRDESGNIKFCLMFDQTFEKAVLSVKIISNENGSETYANLYAISTEKGIFISQLSIDDAWDNYYYSGVTDGEYSFDEYSNLLEQYYHDSVLCTVAEGSSNGEYETYAVPTFGLSGTFKWEDDDGISHPLQYNKVEIYVTYNSGSATKYDTLYTDVNGKISCTIPSAILMGAQGMYLIVYSGGENSIVTNKNGVQYKYKTSTKAISSTSGSLSFSFIFDMDGNSPATNTENQAFQISQAVIVGARYAKEMSGNNLSQVKVVYPHDDIKDHDKTLFYDKNTIYVCEPYENCKIESYADWDAIIHEYGHHVESVFGITAGIGGKHEFGISLVDGYNYSLDKAKKIAWAEAYASVFSLISQLYYADSLKNIKGVADTKYNRRSGGDYDFENNSYRFGEDCEGSTAGVLWDLWDSAVEDHDTISFSDKSFWNLVIGSGAKTITEFNNYFYAKYSGTYITKYKKLLEYYRFDTD